MDPKPGARRFRSRSPISSDDCVDPLQYVNNPEAAEKRRHHVEEDEDDDASSLPRQDSNRGQQGQVALAVDDNGGDHSGATSWITQGDELLKKGVIQGVERIVRDFSALTVGDSQGLTMPGQNCQLAALAQRIPVGAQRDQSGGTTSASDQAMELSRRLALGVQAAQQMTQRQIPGVQEPRGSTRACHNDYLRDRLSAAVESLGPHNHQEPKTSAQESWSGLGMPAVRAPATSISPGRQKQDSLSRGSTGEFAFDLNGAPADESSSEGAGSCPPNQGAAFQRAEAMDFLSQLATGPGRPTDPLEDKPTGSRTVWDGREDETGEDETGEAARHSRRRVGGEGDSRAIALYGGVSQGLRGSEILRGREGASVQGQGHGPFTVFGGAGQPTGLVPGCFHQGTGGKPGGLGGATPNQGALVVQWAVPEAVPRYLATRGARVNVDRHVDLMRKRLVRLATAIEEGDLMEVKALFPSLQPYANSRGCALGRLVHYTLHSLMLRFTGMGPAFFDKPRNWRIQELNLARLWYLKAYPVFPFTGVAVTGMVLNKLMGKKHIHIVDSGTTMIPQWPYLIRLLAQQPGQPLQHIRFTWLDSTYLVNPGRKEFTGVAEGVRMSQGLQSAAEKAGIGFSFEHVALDRESLQLVYEIRRRPQDALVICATFDLMFFPAEGDSGNMRGQLLQWMRFMEPAAVAVVETDMDVCCRPLIPRFKACFDSSFAQFSSHDACATKEERQHMLFFEKIIFGRVIARVISCNGPDRIFQPSTAQVWSRSFQRAGFSKERLSNGMLDAAYEVVRCFPSDFGLTLADETLSLTWRGVPLAFACCWKI